MKRWVPKFQGLFFLLHVCGPILQPSIQTSQFKSGVPTTQASRMHVTMSSCIRDEVRLHVGLGLYSHTRNDVCSFPRLWLTGPLHGLHKPYIQSQSQIVRMSLALMVSAKCASESDVRVNKRHLTPRKGPSLSSGRIWWGLLVSSGANKLVQDCRSLEGMPSRTHRTNPCW